MGYDAPTTPRTRRCYEAGHTFPRRATDPTFTVVTTDVTVSSAAPGETIVFDLEEILMWAALKKAVAGVTESLGIEIPGLPIDLGAVGDTAATAAQGVTESATGAVEGLTGVTETLSGGTAGVTDSVAGAAEGVSASAVDSAAQVLPDVTAAAGALLLVGSPSSGRGRHTHASRGPTNRPDDTCGPQGPFRHAVPDQADSPRREDQHEHAFSRARGRRPPHVRRGRRSAGGRGPGAHLPLCRLGRGSVARTARTGVRPFHVPALLRPRPRRRREVRDAADSAGEPLASDVDGMDRHRARRGRRLRRVDRRDCRGRVAGGRRSSAPRDRHAAVGVSGGRGPAQRYPPIRSRCTRREPPRPKDFARPRLHGAGSLRSRHRQGRHRSIRRRGIQHRDRRTGTILSLIHISEPTRRTPI